MRRKDESKKPIISDFINTFYYEHDKVPSVREIVEGTGIPLSTVHRYLRDMQEKDELGAREKTIHFRVSEAFYEVIAHEARQCGLSISEFCRRVLINRPIKKLPVIIHDEREIKQELRNINKLGNNLNQIARYLNEGGQMNETLSQEIRKTLTTLDLSIHDFNSAVEAEFGQSS